MRKKLLIFISVFLMIAIALGVSYGVMASSTDGEVGISLTIVGTEPTPIPTPTPTPEELGFTVSPDFLALGEVHPGDYISRSVTLTKDPSVPSVIVYVDLPTVPWGTVTASTTAFILHTETKVVTIYFDISESAALGTYGASVLFHK